MEGTILILLIISLLFVVFIFTFAKKPEGVKVFEEIRNPQVLQILVPRENDKTPLAAEQMFASLHGILRESKKSLDLISFEIVSSTEGGIRFYAVVPGHLAEFVEGQIYAQYPNADIRRVSDYVLNRRESQTFVSTGIIELDKSYIFPIKTFRNFEVDPLAAVTSAITDMKPSEEVWIQFNMRPVANYWQEASKKYITEVKEGKTSVSSIGEAVLKLLKGMSKALQTTGDGKGGTSKEVVKLAPGQQEELSQIELKMLKLGFEVGIRVISKSSDQARSEQILRDVTASFKQFTTAHLNSFVHSKPTITAQQIYEDYIKRRLVSEPEDVLNIEELASLYHLPNVTVETPNIQWSRARKAEPPMDLPLAGTPGVTAFAHTDYRGKRIDFGIQTEDRRRHFYLLGKTGVGKSTVFKNMFISDIIAGRGACFIDPHGEAVDELLSYIPQERIKDVIYFDPSDVKYPIGFNLLEINDQAQRDLVADGVVEVFKKQFESWGPRLQYILTNAVATALEAQGTTILSVMRLLNDRNYRKFILKQVKDPILQKFWEEEYAQMSQNSKLITEAVAPIQNKVGRFISSSVMRNIVGQVKSSFNLREVMDEGKILLVNLAQGKLGEESSSLLGGMLITRLQSTAMERVDIPIEQRRDFYLYVDEFQNFATESFAKILSEARKFKLNLTMTNQYIDQIPLTVRQAIFGNAGTLASFVVSQSDASILSNEFAPIFSAEDLVSLESHSMYVKLCINGMTSKPFSAKSLDIRYEKFGNRDEIIQASRAAYGMDQSVIEDKIKRWSEQKYSEKGNRSIDIDRDEDGSRIEKREEKKAIAPTPQNAPVVVSAKG
ncbi:type IV secretion system DNA-binding domain-containing protein [Candidatus Dojkabacteria bacterium]|nr:type IV secretion system DNA-binding domain-containing protein [Candidatus Dojkabacteria bacterium]